VQVETDDRAIWDNDDPEGAEFEPVATLADEYGGRAQIAIDDHCYVVLLKQQNGRYDETPWIFNEAWEVLRDLPPVKEG